MDLTGTTWLAAAPVVILTALVLFVPGSLAARLVGLRGVTAVAVGPALTVSTVVVAGVVAAAAHTPWGPLTFCVAVLALWLVAALVGWLLHRRPEHPDGPVGPALLGGTIAFLGVAVAVVAATGSPSAFPQNPDTIFHLGASQWMLDRGDISPLHAGGFVSASGTGFYPAAFHAVVVTVSSLTGAPVVVSASSVALVAAGLVWPLGCIHLARTTFGPSLRVTLAAAVTSVAFSAFPFLLMGYGVLWPNLLGQALLPAALACFLRLLRFSAPYDAGWGRSSADRVDVGRRPSGLRTALVLVVVLPGLGVAHPNAVVAFLLLGFGIFAEAMLTLAWEARVPRPRRARASLTALAVASALGVLGWAAATAVLVSMRASNPPGPEATASQAVVDTLSFGPRDQARLWVLTLLVLVGAVVILLRGTLQRWVVVSLGVCWGLYFLLVAVDSPLTRLLTWPWYNNSPRLAALMVLPAALAATAALSWLSSALSRRVSGLSRRSAAIVLPVVLVLVTGGGYVGAHRDVLAPFFHPPVQLSWASQGELRALRALSAKVERGAVVAANPWDGASYLYLVSGRRMLFPTEKALNSPDRVLMAKYLDDVGRSPQVCAAARRQHVRYAITGGTPYGTGTGYTHFGGVDRVGHSSAFRKVAVAEPFRLYQLVRCARG